MLPSLSSRSLIATGLFIGTSLALCACGDPPGGTVGVIFPDAQTLQFTAALTKESNFALNGQVLLPPYGDLYFLPPTPQTGFTFGGRLDLKAFQPEGWQFGEVTQLPTGAYFPPHIRSALVQVPLAGDFSAYLGVHGQKTVGIAWSFIKSDQAAIGIGANYYDSRGNIVMSGLFFPPRKDHGQITVHGGLFIATDLTPFVPAVEDSRKLKIEPYVVENGRIRSFTRQDVEVAQYYFQELQNAQKRLGPFRLSSP